MMKLLHLADNSRMIPREQSGHSNIYKVEHVVNSLVHIMKKEISVDDSMIRYAPTLLVNAAYVYNEDIIGDIRRFNLISKLQ